MYKYIDDGKFGHGGGEVVLPNISLKTSASRVIAEPQVQRMFFATAAWSDGHDGRYAYETERQIKGESIYRVKIADAGLINMPGVNKKRCWSYIGPKNKNAQKVLVNTPGFAHTSRYEAADWYVHLLADLAEKFSCAFVSTNPDGRAVPGFDGAVGVGNIALGDSLLDLDHVLKTVIEDSVSTQSREKVQVILSGHSLGGRFAAELAWNMLHAKEKYRGTLHGVLQQSAVGADTLEDLRTMRYLTAVTPHLPGALTSTFGEGLDFSLQDIQDLFYDKSVTQAQLEAAAIGLNRGTSRHFFEISLGRGNVNHVRKIAAALQHKGGWHTVTAKKDGIFGRHLQKESLRRMPHIHTYEILGPHCYLIPGLAPDHVIITQVRQILESVLAA